MTAHSETKARAAARTYRIECPGEGAYRIRLIERSGESAAETFLAGSGRQETVELPPGDYWATVVDIGSGKSSRRIPVTLADSESPLVLPDPTAPPIEAIHSADSAAPATPAVALDQRSSAATPDPQGNPVHVPVRRRESVSTQRRFDIAISEDHAPLAIGGWGVPRPLHVQVEGGGGAGALRVAIRADDPGRKSRVRMSIGLEGLPTIRVPLPLYRDGIVVAVNPIFDSEGGVDLRVEVTAANPRVQALVATLSGLSSSEAMSVLEWAAEGPESTAIAFLAEKVRDLWAATAAAVLLVKAGRIEGVASWLTNLARLAPHIPDAAIAAAWGTIAVGEESDLKAVEARAKHYLVRAGRMGAPNFTVANSLNLELLSSLRSTAVEANVRKVAAREYARATERSRFRLFKSPYMIWEESRERLQGGRLAGDHYLPVARGSVGPEGIRLGAG
ncbi:MAG: hypothetical protein ACXW27_06820 [Allosphingosinicella sp.]